MVSMPSGRSLLSGEMAWGVRSFYLGVGGKQVVLHRALPPSVERLSTFSRGFWGALGEEP
jgi:hypothetical protein